MNVITNLILAYSTILVGGFLIYKLKFFFLFKPRKIFTRFVKSVKPRENRRALLLAMAGTLGVGNIYGVALGIIIGGAGTVFWLFISALFALVIKYSENVLAGVSKASGNGMMGVFEETFKCKTVSKIYAILALIIALTMGAFIQADSFVSSCEYALGMPKIYISIFLVVLTTAVTLGGAEKIKSATELIVPLATVIYILITVVGILSNARQIPKVVEVIIESAFDKKTMIFGIIPTMATVVFTEGFARGILSNEAGVGTSSLANADGDRSPVTSGVFGMCEIIFDTLVLCMLTAFLILTSVPKLSEYTSPMALIFDAATLATGYATVPLLLASIFCFSFSTILCWFFYGQKCLEYLGRGKLYFSFVFFFYLAIILSAFLDTYSVLRLNDLLIFMMSMPTLLSLVLRVETIKKHTKKEELM